jgi:hypothetical protein
VFVFSVKFFIFPPLSVCNIYDISVSLLLRRGDGDGV